MKLSATKRLSGFTLIELMLTVVIIGILVGIAYPSYLEQVQKARRAEAKSALIQLATALERFYTENNTYNGACLEGDAGASCTQEIFVSTAPVEGAGDVYYTLSIADLEGDNDNQDYLITATPHGVQNGDKCGSLTLTSTGVRSIDQQHTGVFVSDCW